MAGCRPRREPSAGRHLSMISVVQHPCAGLVAAAVLCVCSSSAASAAEARHPGVARPGSAPRANPAKAPPGAKQANKHARDTSAATTPQPANAKPKAPRWGIHLFRFQARNGVWPRAIHDEAVIQQTYLWMWGRMSLFANAETVILDQKFSHVEGELNLGFSISADNPWLRPVRFSQRLEIDWTDELTYSAGLQLQLTEFPGVSWLAKITGTSIFMQYYPVKTRSHRGFNDFYFWAKQQIVGKHLYARGFLRLFIHEDREPDVLAVADLIVAIPGGLDVYGRYQYLIAPRIDGYSAGLRYSFILM